MSTLFEPRARASSTRGPRRASAFARSPVSCRRNATARRAAARRGAEPVLRRELQGLVGPHRHLVAAAREEQGVREAQEGVALAFEALGRPGPLAHQGEVADGQIEAAEGVVEAASPLVQEQAQAGALLLLDPLQQRHPAVAVLDGLGVEIASGGVGGGAQPPGDGGREVASLLEVQGEGSGQGARPLPEPAGEDEGRLLVEVVPAGGHEVLVEDLGVEGVGEAVAHGEGAVGELLFAQGHQQVVVALDRGQALLEGDLAGRRDPGAGDRRARGGRRGPRTGTPGRARSRAGARCGRPRAGRRGSGGSCRARSRGRARPRPSRGAPARRPGRPRRCRPGRGETGPGCPGREGALRSGARAAPGSPGGSGGGRRRRRARSEGPRAAAGPGGSPGRGAAGPRGRGAWRGWWSPGRRRAG